MEITYERLEDRPINYISVQLTIESGCNPNEGEYGLYISSFIGCLDICSAGGVDDITLAKECIDNDLDFEKLPNEGHAEIILKESGEWEGYSWHKYYEIERFNIIAY